MAEIFVYVNREQLSHGQIRCRSQAPRKRRHAEDDSIEHRRPRVINIDTGAPSHNPGSIAVAERETLETDIAPVPSRAEAIEHPLNRQDSTGSSNRLVTAQVSQWNKAYTATLGGQEQHRKGSQ